MILSEIFRRWSENAPMPVMVRALLERTFHPARLDAWFEQTAEAQYTRELLFSPLFELMSQVVCRVRRSGHDAYQAAEHIATSVGAVYRPLARIEPTTAAALVRYSARAAQVVMAGLGYARPAAIPGYVVKVRDGNALAVTEHRLKELRAIRGGALPGTAVVVYEPARHLMVDVVPSADGHAQERSLLAVIVNTVQRGEGWIGDRNFCVTDCLVGIAERGAYCIVREHAPRRVTPPAALGARRRGETGMVAEQPVVLTRAGHPPLAVRRVVVQLEQPTRDGDRTVSLLTNLPRAVGAALGAPAYRGRWPLETAFQILAPALASALDT